jgi:hypothetical protein
MLTGQRTATVTVTPLDDSGDEPDETVVLNVVAGSGYNVAATPNHSATVTILDKPTVSVAVTIATAQEAGPVSGRFTITRAATDISAALTVYYSVSGIAKNGVDYNSLSGQIDIPAGLASAPFDNVPVDDTAYEGLETVQLDLAPDFNYEVGASGSAMVNLQDNDTPTIRVVSWDRDAAEPRPGIPADPGGFTISREGDTRAALNVSFIFSSVENGGTAANGVDFLGISTTVTIPVDEREVSIPLTPVVDGSYEGTEQAVLILQNNASYQIDPARSQASVAIKDADIPTVTVAISPDFQSEGTLAQFTFSRTAPANGGATSPLTVVYRPHGTARPGSTAGADYVTLSGSITIAANATSATLPVTLLDDTEPEVVETLKITLAGSTEYFIGNPNNSATLLVNDNEPTGYLIKILKPSTYYNTQPHDDWRGRFSIIRLGSAASAVSVGYQTVYLLSGGGQSAPLTHSLTINAQESEKRVIWKHDSTSQEYLKISVLNVANPPVTNMPCLTSDQFISMSFLNPNLGPNMELQEGVGSATPRVTGKPDTKVRLSLAGSATPWDFPSSVPFSFENDRWLIPLTISAAGTADVTLSALNDGPS